MGINIRRTYSHAASQGIVLGKFTQLQQTESHIFDIQVANDLVTLNVPQPESRWWSPEMSLRIEDRQAGAKIFEVVGPNSSIFTLAMFFIMLGSVTLLAALIMSLSQLYLGEVPYLALVGTLASGIMIVVTFSLLAMGRHKAKDQVQRLRTFVQSVIQL